jgi:ATPase family protein associated with various cellular activities (AAA)/winged helix domain-containing protein
MLASHSFDASPAVLELGAPRTGELFDLELERVRLRAMLAIERDPDAIARIAAELDQLGGVLAQLRPHGRMQQLAARLALAADDVELLWSAVAVAIDPHVAPHAQVLGGNDARRGLTLALHAVIADLDTPRARALARSLTPAHPLLRASVLAWSSEPHAPTARPLVVAPRIAAWLAGDDTPDPLVAVADAHHELVLDDAQRAVLADLPRALASSALVVVGGAAVTGKRAAIAHAAALVGRAVVVLDLHRVARAALADALTALRRECLLRDAIPLVAALDELPSSDADIAHLVGRALDAFPGTVVATTRGPLADLATTRPLVRLRWPTPDAATRRTLWSRALGASPAIDLDLLAQRYRMGAGGIARSIACARLAASDRALTTSDVVAGVRAHIGEQFGELAVRVDVHQTWADLVLPPDILDQVRLVVARVRHARRVLDDWGFAAKLPKGAGVAALLSGPPGTGKTMVAGLIARELDLELYQVDLSKVVSKWVGETEKQLARVFDAAESGHALLLFDEADALFARRTEVKAAVDRYANLEVNYLLQRIESFGGVAILTTNLDTSIDPALRRRLAASIAFWGPDTRERELLWQRMLTGRAPLADDIDIADLADTYDEMTGANIRNSVLAAAFLAADEDSVITHAHLDRAARSEYASMGRVLGKK